MHLSLLENCLEPDLVVSYKKIQEFTAIHAFLLGLRTGRGLPGEQEQNSTQMCPARRKAREEKKIHMSTHQVFPVYR